MSIKLTGATSEKGADEATKIFSHWIGFGLSTLFVCIGASLVLWALK